ncbi:MAG: hypothetical protein HY743_13095 [Deltaproteobacteria bacterium]|nr:hypothetical protein [Deltaproteobacteria bacterium]
MIVNSEPQPERRLPIPLPPETPSPEPGGLKALLRQRFILVALVILIFLGFLFFWGTYQKLHTPEASDAVKEEKPEGAPKIVTPVPPPALPPQAAFSAGVPTPLSSGSLDSPITSTTSNWASWK